MKATIRVTKIKSPDELRRSSDAGSELAAFEAYKTATGARQRKGAPLALRLSCGVSKELDRAGGTRTDRSAQTQKPLPEQATDWAESWAGPGSVFFAKPSGKDGTSVELLVAPVRDSRGKPVISTQKALTELVRQTREMTEYGALQTSWADWCAACIDPAIQHDPRKAKTTGTAKPESPARGTFDTVRSAIRQADLSQEDAERLGALLRLKGEVLRHRSADGTYRAPEGPLEASRLRAPAKGPAEPWPLIEAVRAPAHAVLEAALIFGLGLHCDDPDYRSGSRDFPDLEDRIRLAAVVARCALACAYAEAEVKNRLYPDTRIDEETCWPQGARKKLVRHEDALRDHMDRRNRELAIERTRVLLKR